MPTESRAGARQRLMEFGRRVENAALAAALGIMIGLAFLQIALRNLSGTGLYWADALLRYLVLWIGLLGAMIATRERNHISVDVVSHWLPARRQAAVRVLTDGIAALVCAVLTLASVRFIVQERAGGLKAFTLVPAWLAEGILPLAFLIMSLRFLGHLLADLDQVRRSAVPCNESEPAVAAGSAAPDRLGAGPSARN